MSETRFSVIIPVYNVESYLRRCLESVRNQVYTNFECICVDDGSTDGSSEILCDFAQLGFTILHQKNLGVSAARNAALDVAKGEWIVFVDSDDYLEPNLLQQLNDTLTDSDGVDVLEHSPKYVYRDGNVRVGTHDGRRAPGGVYNAEEVLLDPYGVRFTPLMRVVWNKVFRRALIEKWHFRFPVGVCIAEDVFFAIQYYSMAGKTKICPEIVGYVRVFRPGSALTSMSAEKLFPTISCIRQYVRLTKRRMTRPVCRAVCAGLLSIVFLGKEYGPSIRYACIDQLLKADDFNKLLIKFLVKHGTGKARCFALAYYLSPKWLRRAILSSL